MSIDETQNEQLPNPDATTDSATEEEDRMNTEKPERAEQQEGTSEKRKYIEDEATQQLVSTIATLLGETEETPIWYIRKIVRRAGTEQTMALLKEVLEVEQQGGMLVEDTSRRRTVGGVFFFLAKGKGYLKQKFYPKKKQSHQQSDANASDAGQATPMSQPAWRWEDRSTDIAELRKEQGATNVKITLVGHPGRITNHSSFIITIMQSQKVPTLPKGLPMPPPAPTTYAVYIAAKQWRKVEESLRNPEDVLIAEGYPVIDAKTGTIAVFVTSTATKLLQAAQREQQKAKTSSENS
jgi:hypothetical protein